MTALAQAFRDAGYRDPWDRALHCAIEAWGKYPKADAGAARRNHVLLAMSGDMALAVLQRWQPSATVQMIGWLLTQARQAIEIERDRASKPEGGRDQSRPEPQRAIVPPAGIFVAMRQGVGGSGGPTNVEAQRGTSPASSTKPDAGATCAAQPKNPAPPRPGLTEQADKHAAAMAAKVSSSVRLSRLDTVLINGRPIGDCTVAEVKTWAEQRASDAKQAARDMRFARSLCANLPSTAVIREWWKRPDEVDAIYAKAEITDAV